MLVSLIRGQMAVIRANAFIFLLILLCMLVVSRSENEERREELFLSQLVDSSGKVDEEMAELLWIHCGQDLVHLKEAVEHVNLCFPEETPRSTDNIDMKTQSMVRENIEKLINVLNPQLKQTLLDCVRKNDLFQVAGEEGGSKVWYTKYLDLLFSWPHARERKLAADGLQSAPAPAPNPAVGSPIYIPGPRHQPSRRPPTTKQDPFFPPSSDNSGPEPTSAGENSSKSANSGSDIKRNGGNNQHKTIIIACVVTAAVTFAVATLFFLCCTRAFRKGSGVGRNDEKPLLSLSLSDYSVGSSLNLGGSLSLKEEKLGHQSYINNSNHHKKASSLDSSFYLGSDVLCNSPDERPSSESAGNSAKTSSESLNTSNTISAPVTPPLKPPPGRLSATVQGQPPLNPPPGRAVPLPPEPPASLRPPSRAGPTPPPPPAPPPLQKTSAGAPGPRPPAPPPPAPAGPRPPPPPKTTLAPRPPPLTSAGPKVPRPPSGPKHLSDNEGDVPRAKLKPFFWDKVLANPDHSMVWHQLKAGSFQFNEEMIESLFGYSTAEKNKNEGKESSSHGPSPQFIQILDPKKAQNLSILLKALNVTTEEVCDALIEGNELPTELIQTLLKMAPTTDEELKLRLYSGGISQLGPAERFLKALVNIPFAFKRLEALLFMCSLEEEVAMTKESFETLEVACKELRNSRLFLKLLEAVLKTGNRMNDGTFRGGAQAFKLDTLLKLSDVKGTDGKTTLLHFVVQEIIRSEGLRAARAARESRSFSSIKTDDLMVEETFDDHEEHYRSLGLQVVSRLSSELENVKKAAIIDADSLIGTVAKLGHSLLKTRDFLNTEMKSLEEESGFHQTLKGFVLSANEDVTWLLEEEKRIMALVKSTGDYFHGKAGKDEGLRLFAIVRDFLIMLDKVCREVRAVQKKPAKTQRKEASTAPSSADPRQSPIDPRSSRIDPRQRLFPAIAERRMNGSGSDSDSDSS